MAITIELNAHISDKVSNLMILFSFLGVIIPNERLSLLYVIRSKCIRKPSLFINMYLCLIMFTDLTVITT